MKQNKEFIKVCKSLDIDPESIPPIMSFEIACEWLKIKPALPVIKDLPEKHQAYVIADYKLVTITEAINLDPKTKKLWQPNYNDSNESKYEPRFWIKTDKKRPSGFGFSGSFYDHWFTSSFVGSRLCFKDYDRLNFAQKVHEKLYIERTLILKK